MKMQVFFPDRLVNMKFKSNGNASQKMISNEKHSDPQINCLLHCVVALVVMPFPE
jgi:hypothetical protein